MEDFITGQLFGLNGLVNFSNLVFLLTFFVLCLQFTSFVGPETLSSVAPLADSEAQLWVIRRSPAGREVGGRESGRRQTAVLGASMHAGSGALKALSG
jgi:hypothetical protein